MSAISVRVVEVIPGKSVIGLELPNKKREMVRLSEVISCDTFQSNKSPLTMVLGADISGQPVVVPRCLTFWLRVLQVQVNL